MALKRMDNVGIVVDDLAATIDFFRELGLELEGRGTIEGEWAGRVTGLPAAMRTFVMLAKFTSSAPSAGRGCPCPPPWAAINRSLSRATAGIEARSKKM